MDHACQFGGQDNEPDVGGACSMMSTMSPWHQVAFETSMLKRLEHVSAAAKLGQLQPPADTRKIADDHTFNSLCKRPSWSARAVRR
jgi:hypothetical protein